jgi:hypothetical protein
MSLFTLTLSSCSTRIVVKNKYISPPKQYLEDRSYPPIKDEATVRDLVLYTKDLQEIILKSNQDKKAIRDYVKEMQENNN